jgi:hypothetical protein
LLILGFHFLSFALSPSLLSSSLLVAIRFPLNKNLQRRQCRSLNAGIDCALYCLKFRLQLLGLNERSGTVYLMRSIRYLACESADRSIRASQLMVKILGHILHHPELPEVEIKAFFKDAALAARVSGSLCQMRTT